MKFEVELKPELLCIRSCPRCMKKNCDSEPSNGSLKGRKNVQNFTDFLKMALTLIWAHFYLNIGGVSDIPHSKKRNVRICNVFLWRPLILSIARVQAYLCILSPFASRSRRRSLWCLQLQQSGYFKDHSLRTTHTCRGINRVTILMR